MPAGIHKKELSLFQSGIRLLRCAVVDDRAVLSECCPQAHLTALPGDEIRIEGAVDAEAVGAALLAEGIAVLDLHRAEGDREAFFVDLMGDNGTESAA